MGIYRTGPDFRITVEGLSVDCDTWQIYASLCFHGTNRPQPGDRRFIEARFALFRAISEEHTRAREHGARTIRLHVEIDGARRDLTLGSGRMAKPLAQTS